MGLSFNKLRLVEAIVAYLTVRGKRVGPFSFTIEPPFSKERLVTQVSQALLAAGKDPAPYSSHNFRIGVVSTATKRGMEDSLNRWELECSLPALCERST